MYDLNEITTRALAQLGRVDIAVSAWAFERVAAKMAWNRARLCATPANMEPSTADSAAARHRRLHKSLQSCEYDSRSNTPRLCILGRVLLNVDSGQTATVHLGRGVCVRMEGVISSGPGMVPKCPVFAG